MKKRRIQIVYYSQSGSLKYLIEESMRPYLGDYVLIWNPIHCAKPFPFPWNRRRFFSVFCDSVLQRGCRIVNNEIKIEKDDMILLGFQPWFLHLSLPIQSFINSTQFGRIVKDREVILFTCYRNTGAMARRQMAAHVESRGGHIVAELEISDQSKERSSAFQFVRWFFTGKNNPFRNMEKQQESVWNVLDEVLHKSNRIRIQYQEKQLLKEQYILEKFQRWAHFIQPADKIYRFRLLLFQIWILMALIFVSPIMNRIIKSKKTKNSYE